MSETVLVTGGAGYIGSHACKALALAGYRPVAYDNLVHGHRWAVRWGPLEEGELADGERLDAVIQAHRPTAVLHFARSEEQTSELQSLMRISYSVFCLTKKK